MVEQKEQARQFFALPPPPPFEKLELTGRVKKTDADPILRTQAVIWQGLLDGSKLVAIKCPRVVQDKAFEERLLREYSCWVHTDHKNVVPLLGFCTDIGRAPMAMVSPWMAKGTALDFVIANPTANKLELVMGMARGLEYLHSLGIVHGDVRCSNILISDDNEALISDFGLSTYLPKMSVSNNLHGSFRWRAPEMHSPEKFNLTVQQANSLPADVWSFGMTILELITTKMPYFELDMEGTVLDAIMSGRLPVKPASVDSSENPKTPVVDILWPFCLQCWVFFPSSRPNMQNAIQTLRALSRAGDWDTSLDLMADKISDVCEKFTDRVAKSTIDGKVKILHRIIVTVVIVCVFLVWDILSRGGWPRGLFYPWLAGSATWLVLQFDRSQHGSFTREVMEVLWQTMKSSAYVVFVEAIGYMIVEYFQGNGLEK